MPDAEFKSLVLGGERSLTLDHEDDLRLDGVDLNAPSGVYASLEEGPRAVSVMSERQMVDLLSEALSQGDVSMQSLVEGGQLPGYIYELFRTEFDILMTRISTLRTTLTLIPESASVARDGILLAIKEHVAVFCLQNYRRISVVRLIGEGDEVVEIVRRAKVKAALAALDPKETMDVLRSLGRFGESSREEMDILLGSISQHLMVYLEKLGYRDLTIFDGNNRVVAVPVDEQAEGLIDETSPWKGHLESNVRAFFHGLELGHDYPYDLQFEVVMENYFLTRNMPRTTQAQLHEINEIDDRLRHQKRRVVIGFSLRKK